MERKKVTISDLMAKKESGEKITMITAYDYPTAKMVDQAGIDTILVGDSLGMVVLGYDSTVPVTMDEMLHHSKAVMRAIQYAFVIGDMPFMSYQISIEKAVENAGRFIKEGSCDAVKLEGGSEVAQRAIAVINAGIPVLGHIGLTPQSVSKLGGYRVQGKDPASAARLINDAKCLAKAGCFAVILECVPKELAKKIADKVDIPIIGIGAGAGCDGQVLVTYDMVGYFDKFVPKFVKQYADISGTISDAIRKFKSEIESGDFPDDKHSFTS